MIFCFNDRVLKLKPENFYEKKLLFGLKLNISTSLAPNLFIGYYRRLKNLLYSLLIINKKCKKITRKYGIQSNRIIFYTFQCQFTCNCKYIAKEISKRNLDYEIFFVINNDLNFNDIPENVKFVKRNTTEYYYILSTSKIWIDNALNFPWYFVPKNQNQIYLNTWHGSLGIKRISGAKYWRKVANYSNKISDYFITNSVFEENVFKSSFWPDVQFLKFGHARNDILFDNKIIKILRNKVCNYYNITINDNTKIFMYAPTFRDNRNDISFIKMDYNLIKETLEKKFGGNWIILSRLHYKNAQNINLNDLFHNNKEIIDASDYPDMQELIAATDIGVTDYSSWIFDYLLMKKPGFIYAEDIQKYINSRGFYYPLSDTPFDIAETNQQLVNNILTFDNRLYLSKVEKFLKDKICYEDGNAAKKVVDYICNI